MSTKSLTREMWNAITPIFSRILKHPFVAGLADGTLPGDAFRFYVVQDAHYLRAYARALSMLSARAPDEDSILMFSRHATGAIEVERSLHESFFGEFGMSEDDVAKTPMAPTNSAYTSYLLSVVSGSSFAQGLAAVLPCYWIYWEVGKTLLEKGSPDPLYRRWIDTYGSEDFGAVVKEVLVLTDSLAVTDEERISMRNHFVTTSRYEWMFWDMGYRMETWPV